MSYATSVVKSIQTGNVSFTGVNVVTGTATITTVDVTKAIVLPQGSYKATALGLRWQLTNATTVTVSTEGDNGVGANYKGQFTVLEFY
jgi:hypothetical protein